VSVPFYFKLKQPLRGILAVIFTIAVGAIFYYLGSQKFWWEEAVKPISFAVLPNYLLVLFAWMFVYANYFHFWPWGKLSQPLQGVASTLTIIVLSGINFYVLNNMAHWGAHLFYISSAWLFWIFMFGAWTDNPLATQYAGKQPICGVSGYVITLGMALLTWWLAPASFLGNASGVPFTWFLVAVAIAFCLQMFPIQIGLPWRAFGILGWFVVLSFLLIWVLKALGLDPFAVTFPVPASMDEATGYPVFLAAKGSTFSIVLLMSILTPVALFQMWPFHKLSYLRKGFLWMVLGTGIGIVAYWIITSISLDPVVISKVVTWGFCLFVGMFVYYTNFAGALAPDPGAQVAVPERKEAAAAAPAGAS
jgi:hypothetical protein